MIKYYNEDCMIGMARYPDKYFDLAIVDPPYRNQSENQPTKDMRRNGKIEVFGDKPDKTYFDELFRVSKNQIIWGANNFTLPNYKGFVIWKKLTISEAFTMSMAELAYISEGLGTVSKIFECAPQGTASDPRIHPTQKPVALYKWLLTNYAKEGDLILDTHVGSASSLIACHELGFDAVGFELDEDYYKASLARLQAVQKQVTFDELIKEDK
ncbi:MAG: site-specific DNA-methyltransferase [Clostridiaceae bacterium]|nr:site-specific DNA-methyltransferase [Clostridiaceae bacterium]